MQFSRRELELITMHVVGGSACGVAFLCASNYSEPSHGRFGHNADNRGERRDDMRNPRSGGLRRGKNTQTKVLDYIFVWASDEHLVAVFLKGEVGRGTHEGARGSRPPR